MRELQEAINKTNEYASKYGQKLNKRQLFLRLISKKIYKYSDISDIKNETKTDNEWERKVALAKLFADKHLLKMKGIRMVGITGSVAAEAAKKSEDIDFLIVTSNGELWWWRLYLRLYVWWNKIPHRKFRKVEKENEFCFNLWLDEFNLAIPKNKRNLKNATDLIMMKIILDKDNCYQRFLKENEWVKHYLATGYDRLINNEKYVESKKGGFIKRAINLIIFGCQYLYMWSKRRQKLKNIEFGQAFFHEDN